MVGTTHQQHSIRPGYKQTEVGVIPEDWEIKTLGSILNRCHLGGNYSNQDRETNYPLMKMGNVNRGYIDTDKVEYISPGVTPDPIDRLNYGDVLFNTRNTLDLVGKVAIWRNELPVAYFNSNLMRLEFNRDEVSSHEYANYAFNSASGLGDGHDERRSNIYSRLVEVSVCRATPIGTTRDRSSAERCGFSYSCAGRADR